jgi:ubiquinone/menaquinone biosynthesis C-methylase UbiE
MARYPTDRSSRVTVEERPREAVLHEPAVPHYLQQVYWWAYVHPKAVHVFEREWLVNAILFGNYGRLRDAALADLGPSVGGTTLQVACAYGNLTARLQQRLAPDARLDVLDILPIQLHNLARKLAPDERVCLLHGDSAALACGDACYDQVLLFFLLHEQPEAVRRATLSEALRVVKPGGKVIIVDYHQPALWHPMRSLMRLVFARLEPYAMDLWHHEVTEFMPRDVRPASLSKRTYFGGLYQKLVLIR